MIKFIFDLDGTITSSETLPIIAKNFNIHRELEGLTRDTVNGKIPWRHSFIRRVDLLKHVPVNDINTLLTNTPLYKNLLKFIQANLEDCYIATGNLDCWVDGLCKKIGCVYYSSKALVKNDEIVEISYIIEKSEVVKMLQEKGYKTVFVGDSNNDVNAMRKADISIAYGASHRPSNFCLTAADHVVYTESELISLLTSILEVNAL